MVDSRLALRAAEIVAQPFDYRHPLDAVADIWMFPLGMAARLTRSGIKLAHLSSGKVSFALHRHLAEDEWIYLIAGNGTLRMDTEDITIGADDFAAFPAGGPAHKLTKTGTEVLVYLMGGSVADVDIVDFPEAGLRMTRTGQNAETRAQVADAAAFIPFDYFARMKHD